MLHLRLFQEKNIARLLDVGTGLSNWITKILLYLELGIYKLLKLKIFSSLVSGLAIFI